MEPSGGADALTVSQRLPDRFHTVLGHGLATASFVRSAKPGEDALSDHRPLELREDRQHLEHHPARGRRGVEALLVQVEVHVLGLDVAQEAHEVREGSPKAVHAPCRDQFEVLSRHSLEQVVVAGAPIPAFHARDTLVGEGGGHGPALTLGDGQ